MVKSVSNKKMLHEKDKVKNILIKNKINTDRTPVKESNNSFQRLRDSLKLDLSEVMEQYKEKEKAKELVREPKEKETIKDWNTSKDMNFSEKTVVRQEDQELIMTQREKIQGQEEVIETLRLELEELAARKLRADRKYKELLMMQQEKACGCVLI
eukprot:CAMPEP_0116940090 /NCGR_PEP_ID=MMETSP0467-20121206/33150_1 /TAXON_ID=283647 /ORGANISM="Mesodinium pulex, Strain SPMC105" /LENGTH=154 /DNA_ID=CAMNT_0004622545 /DNA_START=234 /DNA_END=698 /DNA_ORIENTATION=-